MNGQIRELQFKVFHSGPLEFFGVPVNESCRLTQTKPRKIRYTTPEAVPVPALNLSVCTVVLKSELLKKDFMG